MPTYAIHANEDVCPVEKPSIRHKVNDIKRMTCEIFCRLDRINKVLFGENDMPCEKDNEPRCFDDEMFFIAEMLCRTNVQLDRFERQFGLNENQKEKQQ